MNTRPLVDHIIALLNKSREMPEAPIISTTLTDEDGVEIVIACCVGPGSAGLRALLENNLPRDPRCAVDE